MTGPGRAGTLAKPVDPRQQFGDALGTGTWSCAGSSLSIVVPSRSADQAPDRQLPAWAVDRLRGTRNGLLSQDCAEQDSGS
jgi:hypothetical protein